jgi:uncharacterized protein
MRVLLLGASGFVGRHLAAALAKRGDDIATASLRDPATAAATARTCDAIVNLAGETIAARWNEDTKRRIETSRVNAPRAFLDALARGERVCRIYVSASAVGFYGTSESAIFDEASPAGSDFLARVCVGWERVASSAADLGMRVAFVRTGIVLGTDGGALPTMLVPFRLGLGGIAGSGRQWYSWIHIADLVGIYLLALDSAAGALNGCAPNPVTNAEFTHALGTALHRPTILPTPAFVFRAMLGEGATIVVDGQRVLPKRTQDCGYRFEFPLLSGALANLL